MEQKISKSLKGRRFVLTDIHGCMKTFRRMVEENFQLKKEDQLYLLGDYIDRGPDSKGVIDYIWELESEGHSVNCLRGNHEQMLLNSYEDSTRYDLWLRNGGKETLISFEANDINEIPETYLSFFRQLPYFFELEDFWLVHAGFSFENTSSLDEMLSNEHALIWIRNWYDSIDYELLKNKRVIHGHTPQSKEKLSVYYNTKLPLCIDCGCVYKAPNLGLLCGIELNSKELFWQSYIG